MVLLFYGKALCVAAAKRLPITFSRLTLVSHEFSYPLPARDFGVHSVWRQIDFAGPSDRAVVDEYLSEKLLVPKRF